MLVDADPAFGDVELSCEVDQPLPLHADPAKLRQVLWNLVRNAAESGGKHVRVEVRSRGDEVAFSIADDGRGIPPDEREHVFKRFYRLEQSRYTSGNGLGLSLVAAVARLHDAQIEMLDNSPGLKVTLWFSPPAG